MRLSHIVDDELDIAGTASHCWCTPLDRRSTKTAHRPSSYLPQNCILYADAHTLYVLERIQ
jgi:hypothetical protein